MAGLFRQGLATLKDRYPDVIAEVRGEWLLMGVKTVIPNLEFVAAARAEHLLTVGAAENVVRLIPPLNITAEEVRIGLDRIEAACRRSAGKKAA